MNTVVFVITVIGYFGNYIPSLEFKTMDKCNSAITQITSQLPPKTFTSRENDYKCVKVEK